VAAEIRDEVVDFVLNWSERSMIPRNKFCQWLSIPQAKLCAWNSRYGQVNNHNARQPRNSWLLPWEREAIADYYQQHREIGYRRLCYMMLDEDVVAVSPSSVYRVLTAAGLLRRWNKGISKKGTGFDQPLRPHEHWHIDISYINLGGTFYYLIAILDGYSRYLVHWEIRESMTNGDVQIVVQRAVERYPEASPRLISDNGKQFTAREFKDYLRHNGMKQVRTSPYYPQSNGKLERWNGTVKQECIRPQCPANAEEARRVMCRYADEYNNHRLHSAIGYVTPRDRLLGFDVQVWEERRSKLATARAERERIHRAKLAETHDEHSLNQTMVISDSV
jgi:transposase InsO family protein